MGKGKRKKASESTDRSTPEPVLVEVPPEETANTLPDAHAVLLSVAGLAFVAFVAFVYGYAAFGERAVDGLEKLVAEAAFESGNKQKAVGNMEEAARYFRQALQGRFADPNRRNMCGIALGDALTQLGRYDEAIDAYRSLSPEAFASAGSLAGYVEALRRNGNFTEAEARGKEWLAKAEAEKSAQQQQWARYALASVYLEMDRPDDALPHLLEVLRREPGHGAAIQAARILHRQGKTAEAVALLDAFLAKAADAQARRDAEALRGQIAGAPAS